MSNQKYFKLLIYPLFGFVLLSGDLNSWNEKLTGSLPSWFISSRINNYAKNITFKVYDDENFLGSGTLIQRQKNQYFVLTNKHVLRSGQSPYQVKAPDGNFYGVSVLDLNAFPQDDLVILSFYSDRAEFSTPKFKDYSQLRVNEDVFAVGFPLGSTISKETLQTTSPPLTITQGRVTKILDKPLLEGYQIAYSNNVRKGMSGGPLFNREGKVVGVNGKQAYPLWELPDLYQDKSPVESTLQSLINRSSLAIPITKALNFATPPD